MYLDCPRSVRVSPSYGPYQAGDVLKCVSDGYPEPSYTWTDDDGVVVSTASTMRLSEGVFNLTCTVTGNFTTPCSASNSITGNATGKISQLTMLYKAYFCIKKAIVDIGLCPPMLMLVYQRAHAEFEALSNLCWSWLVTLSTRSFHVAYAWP